MTTNYDNKLKINIEEIKIQERKGRKLHKKRDKCLKIASRLVKLDDSSMQAPVNNPSILPPLLSP